MSDTLSFFTFLQADFLRPLQLWLHILVSLSNLHRLLALQELPLVSSEQSKSNFVFFGKHVLLASLLFPKTQLSCFLHFFLLSSEHEAGEIVGFLLFDTVGDMVSVAVGAMESVAVGAMESVAVGAMDGTSLGTLVGTLVGAKVGFSQLFSSSHGKPHSSMDNITSPSGHPISGTMNAGLSRQKASAAFLLVVQLISGDNIDNKVNNKDDETIIH